MNTRKKRTSQINSCTWSVTSQSIYRICKKIAMFHMAFSKVGGNMHKIIFTPNTVKVFLEGKFCSFEFHWETFQWSGKGFRQLAWNPNYFINSFIFSHLTSIPQNQWRHYESLWVIQWCESRLYHVIGFRISIFLGMISIGMSYLLVCVF